MTKKDVFSNFKVSPNQGNVTSGFYATNTSTRKAITQQTWTPETENTPLDRSAAISWAKAAIDAGESEESVSMQLQSTGWSAPQSKAIIDLSKR